MIWNAKVTEDDKSDKKYHDSKPSSKTNDVGSRSTIGSLKNLEEGLDSIFNGIQVRPKLSMSKAFHFERIILSYVNFYSNIAD